MAARVVEEPVVVGEQRLGHEVAAGAWRNIGHGIVGREDVRACVRVCDAVGFRIQAD